MPEKLPLKKISLIFSCVPDRCRGDSTGYADDPIHSRGWAVVDIHTRAQSKRRTALETIIGRFARRRSVSFWDSGRPAGAKSLFRTHLKPKEAVMMKWKENRVVLCLALCAACLVVLAACSGNSDDTVETETTPVETTPVEEETRQTVMGQVSYVGSAYISVSVYEADGEVEDYAALDPASLTPTEQTESITTTDDTEYWKVEDGGLVQADREEITTEAMIVSTYTEDGTHQVILLAAEQRAACRILLFLLY